MINGGNNMRRLRDVNKQKQFTQEEYKLNQWKTQLKLDLGLINEFDSGNYLSAEEELEYIRAEAIALSYINNGTDVPEDIKRTLLTYKDIKEARRKAEASK